MGVRHFHAENCNSHPLARHGGLQCEGDLAGEFPEAGIGLPVEVEDVVVLHVLRYHQGMARSQRVDVEKCVVFLILRHLV